MVASLGLIRPESEMVLMGGFGAKVKSASWRNTNGLMTRELQFEFDVVFIDAARHNKRIGVQAFLLAAIVNIRDEIVDSELVVRLQLHL